MEIEYIKYLLKDKREFASFRELCEYLGEHYNGQSRTRDSLSKKFRQYFEFEKITNSHKIVITEVFDKKKENFSTTGGSLPKYLDPAVLTNLNEGEHVTTQQIEGRLSILEDDIIKFHQEEPAKRRIAKKLDKVNEIERDLEDWFEAAQKTKEYRQLNTLISITNHLLKDRIDGSLDRLKRKKIIDFEHGYVINFNRNYSSKIIDLVANEDYTKLKECTFPHIYDLIMEIVHTAKEEYMGNSTEDCIVHSNIQILLKSDDNETRMANDEETTFIEEIYNQVLKEKKYKNIQALHKQNEGKYNVVQDYYNSVKEKLAKYNVSVFKGYHITRVNNKIEVNEEDVSRLKDEFLKELRKSRKKSLFSKGILGRFKKTSIVNDENKEKLKKAKAKAENYYYTFEKYVDKFLI